MDRTGDHQQGLQAEGVMKLGWRHRVAAVICLVGRLVGYAEEPTARRFRIRLNTDDQPVEAAIFVGHHCGTGFEPWLQGLFPVT